MKQRTFVLGLLVGLAVGVAAPSLRAADKETRQMMADIRMLQEQTQQLQNLIGQLSRAMSESLDAATRTVNSRVDGKLDEQNANTIRAFANQKLSLDAITRDVNVLRERVDESNVRVGQLTQEVTALRQLVTQLTSSPRTAVDPVFGPPDGATAASPVPALNVGASPKAAWDEAYNQYTAGQYDLAIQAFQSYVKDFPKTEMTDDAQVYVCNSYNMQGNNTKVIEQCDLAIRNFPTSDRLAEAYYRKGQAYKNLGRFNDARTAFQYIVKTFPNTQEANLAQTQLGSPQLAPPR